MAKRKEDPPKAGSPAWMATFSDLMNLLLCFFILLFASSTIDAEKLEQVAASFSNQNYSVLPNGATAIGDGKLVSNGVKQLSVLDNYVSSLGRNANGDSDKLSSSESEDDPVSDGQKEQESTTQDNKNTEMSQKQLKENLDKQGLKQSEEMSQEIKEIADKAKIQDLISMNYNAQYVQISLNGGVLFESGHAEISSEGLPLLKKVGRILEKYRKRTIEIEGHTDNVPIQNNALYPNNQYLSSARAISVYEYLIKNHNLIPKNIKHSGYGENHPKASNKTAEGRAKNRRVEIKIYNQLSSTSEQ